MLIFFEYLYFRIANYYSIIDKPNDRSSHTEVTIRGGGIIFLFAGLVYFIYSGFDYPYFFVGLIFVGVISFLDDIFTLSSQNRLIFQFLATSLMLQQINFDAHFLSFFILVIICVGVLNAFNFMDGVNGMTGGYSLVNLLSLLYINNYVVRFVEDEFIIFISLGVMVFNIFNFRKRAKCFAGDVGSISIAFIIIFFLMKLIFQTSQYIYILFLTLYGIDTVFTLFIRIWLKENIFTAHKRHFFQLLVHKCYFPHLQVSLLFIIVQLIINIFIIFLVKSEQDNLYSCIILLAITSCIYIYYRIKIIKRSLTIK